MKPVVAVIGTTHPWNAAGLGLDLIVLHELGAVPLVIVAGVSAQAPDFEAARFPVPPATIASQFEALRTAPIGAFVIGALLAPESVEAVVAGLASRPAAPVVCDPVFRSSDDAMLADAATMAALRERLFPRCTLVTPNIPEAEALLERQIPDLAAMERAAHALRAQCGAAGVLLKGGHHAGATTDVLATADEGSCRFTSERLEGELRGTGNILAAGIGFALASGAALPAAVEAGRATVRARWHLATSIGGMRIAL